MDELLHYGTPRHSGRYPWGSGENPYQHSDSFRRSVADMRATGMTDTEIADAMHMSTWEFRKRVSVAKAEEKYQNQLQVQKLKDKGYSAAEIARITNLPDSTVRSYLKDIEQGREDRTRAVADLLRSQVDEKGMIDVGVGVEKYIGEDGIPKTRMANAVAILEGEGYEVHEIKVEQATNPGKFTTVQVLCPPGTTWKDVNDHPEDIHSIENYTFNDDGREYTDRGIVYPKSIDSSRVAVNYAEDGGDLKDGYIELRRGVKDIDLGDSKYAQVRIAVDDSHYIKGMAVYSDDLPPGVDIRFNTSKHEGTPMMGPKDNTVLKLMSDDPDNPFGSTIKERGQSWYIDENGKEQLGVVNKVHEEGDWKEWEKTLPSQFLSKQNLPLINKQLDLSYSEKQKELEEISSLTNLAVKKTFLESFADDCDAAAVNLKAAALPNQTSKVILPVSTMKDNEIFCPTLDNGTRVVLIRYPHQGTFEIPELVVNNKQKDALKAIGNNAVDAVGINANVAERLSGADFDGDTVTVIPLNNKFKISTSAPLTQLKDFRPKEVYKAYPGMPRVAKEDHFDTQLEMGMISNLITDMTIKGASSSELARATKHSLVVIDAEKHNLNYKQSYIDNGIEDLKRLYQVKDNDKGYGGASTIISRAKSPVYVYERKKITPNKETGEKQYLEKPPKKMKDGTYKKRKQESTRMGEAKDAYSLVSSFHSPVEMAYAKYANQLKAIANAARKEAIAIKSPQRNTAAEKTYAAEVSSLNAKLNNALKNSPRERQAQLITRARVKAKIQANPELKDKDHKSELKKLKAQTLANARREAGASKKNVLINITPKEWEAIQAGAVSFSKSMAIFQNTDQDTLRQLATPKATNKVSSSTEALIKSMSRSGYTISEIADRVGLSSATVADHIK